MNRLEVREQRICTIPGCGKKLIARGWCAMHYWRWRERGDVRWEPTPPTRSERFWKNVQTGEGCWLWLGRTTDYGYGIFTWAHNDPRGAHRAAWELEVGPIPEGLNVCHHCDNPPCVRPNHPDHLFLGTQGDNVRDCVVKGRSNFQRPHTWAKGESHYAAKLTQCDADEIRRRFDNGERKTDLARAFGVSWGAIQFVVKGVTWIG